ncbi:hypothetical protein E2C01_067437 [Portunus trituberculatus]|uniref:Uncharacterized protein n=1 Tax=Portunus trituberculatus TaxID=210409 RepID=A0A5B7HTM1_PORTR|nr:hypothetical protein [Portunus trituberculatus]
MMAYEYEPRGVTLPPVIISQAITEDVNRGIAAPTNWVDEGRVEEASATAVEAVVVVEVVVMVVVMVVVREKLQIMKSWQTETHIRQYRHVQSVGWAASNKCAKCRVVGFDTSEGRKTETRKAVQSDMWEKEKEVGHNQSVGRKEEVVGVFGAGGRQVVVCRRARPAKERCGEGAGVAQGGGILARLLHLSELFFSLIMAA